MTNKIYNLEPRTTKFGIEILRFTKKIPKNIIINPIIHQLVKSGTSIGANYCEADDAESGMDFKHKISICKKEARETKYWLTLLKEVIPEFDNDLKILYQEADELNLIFNKIVQIINDKHKK